jgi:hypothetical protein
MTDTTETKPARAWYAKKRYWIPAALLALFVWIGVSGDLAAEPAEPAAPAAPEEPAADIADDSDPEPEPVAEGDPCNAETGVPGPGEGIFERDIDGGLSCVAQPEEQPEPEPARLKLRDFELEPRIVEQQCFGSAGCSVTFRVELAYNGLEDAITEDHEITYEVTGTEDSLISTLEIHPDGTFTSEEHYVDTASKNSDIKIKATRIEASP